MGGSRYASSDTTTQTGQSVTLTYAMGQASGPVVWDRVVLGGYSVEHQALSGYLFPAPLSSADSLYAVAAQTVQSEPLSGSFAGILGLALPSNSFIAQKIPPTETDAPDGAALASNLFSITPADAAPGARFFSLLLARPEDPDGRSVLGIGRHPTDGGVCGGGRREPERDHGVGGRAATEGDRAEIGRTGMGSLRGEMTNADSVLLAWIGLACIGLACIGLGCMFSVYRFGWCAQGGGDVRERLGVHVQLAACTVVV